jgi:hypothetical protein
MSRGLKYDALPDAARKAFDEKFEAVLNDPHGVGESSLTNGARILLTGWACSFTS